MKEKQQKQGLGFDLGGRWILVTGGAGHLGRAMVRGILAANGCCYVLGSSDTCEVFAAEQAKIFGPVVEAVRVDMYDKVALFASVQQILKKRPLYGLVNNAFDISERTGFAKKSAAIESLSDDQWDHALEAGLSWAYTLMKSCIPSMRQAGGGSIVNISSMYGVVAPDPQAYEDTPFFSPPQYAAVKAGLIGLTRYAASYYGIDGIRCNALAPGAFPKEEGLAQAGAAGAIFRERLSSKTALGRIGLPDDIAGPLVFLLSDASAYITGQVLAVDGGWTCR